MDINDVLTEPEKLVRLELKNAGFDIDKINVPQKVYLLADTIVPRRIIVLTYRNHTADYYRRIPFHVYLNVLCFTARFFLFILTISSLTRIVFHETKKRERTA